VPAPKVIETQSVNLKFYGFAKRHDQSRQIFLSEGDAIFIGREGEIVDRHYRILHISENWVEVEDLLNNNRVTLRLVAQGQS
jgi:hypothetical protein